MPLSLSRETNMELLWLLPAMVFGGLFITFGVGACGHDTKTPGYGRSSSDVVHLQRSQRLSDTWTMVFIAEVSAGRRVWAGRTTVAEHQMPANRKESVSDRRCVRSPAECDIRRRVRTFGDV